jgi:hypothetical protein
MARRVHKGTSRPRRREPQRMVDDSALRLVPAGQAREDRQAGGVGRCPGRRPNVVRAQAPGRARPGVPATTRAREPAELVEAAGVPVDEQRMVVASVLDVNPFRDWVADSIALVCVLERDLRPWRRAGDDVERDSDRAAVPDPGTEVGVQPGVEPDRADQRRRISGDGQLVDAPVPRIRAREDWAPWRAR